MEVHGHVADGFERVRDAFVGNFEAGEELGASACVVHDGEVVVDIWGGDANPAGDPWERDTIVNVYSSTKTMAGTAMLVAADRGLIDFEAPVADYWPEFAQNGKADVRVKHIMSHSAGLPGFDEHVEADDLYDWDGICDRLARQAPWWEPGTVSGYHAVTQGFLQGEVLHRADGRSIGTFFREEVAEPLGADFHIGLAEKHDHRVAELVPPESGSLAAGTPDPDSVAHRTMASVRITGLEPRTRAWRAAEIPAAGGIGNARSIARVHAALACGGTLDGVTLLSPEGVAVAQQEQTSGKDLVLGVYMIYGMGFGLMNPRIPFTPSPNAFYWGGWGGSIAVIDTDTRTSIAYDMNKMGDGTLGDLRSVNIINAFYSTIA